MTKLQLYFLWAALLAMIFVLGQADHLGRPIINFASYFYLAAMIGVPVTLFFPSLTRGSAFLAIAVGAGVYIGTSLLIKRSHSTTSTELPVIVWGFLLLEAGIWAAHQLAFKITYDKCLMDTLAVCECLSEHPTAITPRQPARQVQNQIQSQSAPAARTSS